MRHFVLLASFLFACSSSSTPAAAPAADASVDVLSTPIDPGCQEQSFSQTRPDPPTTACLPNASCRFAVDNGIAGCDGGATSYPTGPVNWTCDCETDSRWNCNVDPSSDAGTAACP